MDSVQNLATINVTGDDSLVIGGAETVDYGFDAYCDLRRRKRPHYNVWAQVQ
jgi:hypothetical protein